METLIILIISGLFLPLLLAILAGMSVAVLIVIVYIVITR